jgi:hypothetical protein
MMNTSAPMFDASPRSAHWYEVVDLAPGTAAVSGFAGLRRMLGNWARQAALLHAEAPLWDIAQSDSRVMAELMLARKADDSFDTTPLQAMSGFSEADTVAAVVPKRASLLGQGWARVIEDAYQVRTRNALWRYA